MKGSLHRRAIGLILALAGVAAVTWVGGAAAKERMVGNWLVTNVRSRFSDKTIVEARTGRDGYVFIARCNDDLISYGLIEPDAPFLPGVNNTVNVKIRVDDGPIMNSFADVKRIDLIAITDIPRLHMFSQIRKAHEIALLVTGAGSPFERVFKVHGTKAAFLPLSKACAYLADD